VDSGARFDRMLGLQKAVEAAERRLTELDDDMRFVGAERINAEDLRRTLVEFDAIWSSLITKEQEQLIQLLVAKVGYDGRTGKLTVNFCSEGAKEQCQARS